MDMIAGLSPIRAITPHPSTAMPIETNEFVIRGVTQTGKTFRPSDWAERLCGVMAQCGADRRMHYSPYVWQVLSEGVTCVVVDGRLEDIEPMAYRFLMNFARDNELDVRTGRTRDRDAPADSAASILVTIT
jgi:hypothetical protein